MAAESSVVPEAVREVIEGKIVPIEQLFRSLMLALATHQVGTAAIAQASHSVRVNAVIAAGVTTEPIPIQLLRNFSGLYPNFIQEEFQGKLIQLWKDLLRDIFSIFLDLHIRGTRPFKECGSLSIKVNFREERPLSDVFRDSVLKCFDFEEHRDQFRIVNKALGREELPPPAKHIFQHAQFRNAIQHHFGVLGADIFRMLGCSEIILLDGSGEERRLHDGDKVEISLPELNKLRMSILEVMHKWKR